MASSPVKNSITSIKSSSILKKKPTQKQQKSIKASLRNSQEANLPSLDGEDIVVRQMGTNSGESRQSIKELANDSRQSVHEENEDGKFFA